MSDAIEHRQWEAALAKRCLEVPYLGAAHESIYERVCELRATVRQDVHYSVYAALIQASGLGKTRAVLEMCRLGVCVCYCSWASARSTACPPRSAFLADMVVKWCSATESETGAVLYLKAWMLVLNKYLEAGVSAEEWMQMQLSGDRIFEEVASCLVAEQAKNRSLTEDMDLDRDARNLQMLQAEIEQVTCKLQKFQQVQVDGMECGSSDDEDAGFTVTAPGVIFIFDEARGLLSGDDISKSPFYNIRRALRVFFNYHWFFALVLDTDAKMSNLVPLDDHSARARPYAYGTSLLPAIYYIPNVGLTGPQPNLKFEDYVSPLRWLKYGRPMWAARMLVDPSPWRQKCTSVVHLAGLKLLRTLKGSFQGKDVDILAGVMTESQAMAMLAAAAGLEVCPRSVLAQTMTASHMSILLRMTEDRSMVFVTLPPEPALSEAAAGFLCSSVVQVGALQHMVGACKQGFVTPGPRGEFVAKYILAAAVWSLKRDFCLEPIPLEHYLCKLLYNRGSDRSAWAGLRSRSLPWKGYVFFNSFVAVNKVPDVAILARCWAMGQAIMCSAENNLPGADIIVPVWTPTGMTAMVVSVKNLQRAGWLEKVSDEKVKCEFTKVEVAEGLPVITIVMSLREPVVKESSNWLLWEEPGAGEWERHVHLTTYGLSDNFAFIPSAVKKLLAEVLVTVPNPLHGSDDQEKEWIRGMVPDVSMLPRLF